VPKGWDVQRLYNGHRLPGARLVSLELVRTEKVTSDDKFSGMFMQWGQVSASEFSIRRSFHSRQRKEEIYYSKLA